MIGFDEVEDGLGRSLFADDGEMCKRGRKVEYLMKQTETALDKMAGLGS